jgi:cytidine deaminase
MCRERLLQFSPDVMVIIPFGGEVIKVPVKILLPAAYGLRNRPNGNSH